MFRIVFVASFVTILVIGVTAKAQDSTFEPGFNRPGGDYANTMLNPGSGPKDCMAKCIDDNRCKAWTYVNAGAYTELAQCWFKSEAFPKIGPIQAGKKTCCTSGMILSNSVVKELSVREKVLESYWKLSVEDQKWLKKQIGRKGNR